MTGLSAAPEGLTGVARCTRPVANIRGPGPFAAGRSAAVRRSRDMAGSASPARLIPIGMKKQRTSVFTVELSQQSRDVRDLIMRGGGVPISAFPPIAEHGLLSSCEQSCLVAAARGADLAEERGDDERAKRWLADAEKIKAEVLAKGVSGPACSASTTRPTIWTPHCRYCRSWGSCSRATSG
jgi:hypothetical protein